MNAYGFDRHGFDEHRHLWRHGRESTWAHTVGWSPHSMHRARDVDDVVAVVRSAGEQGRKVRPVGAGHSFTALAATSDVQIRLDLMRGLVAADLSTGRARIRAGTYLHEIPDLLAPHGLAMANMGDIDEQTLAGAIATGTHGTGTRFGGLSTQVRGLKLVLADGSVVRCSETERPDLFAAARVGLGAFGIVVEVTLQCVPEFGLAADERPAALDELLDDLDGFAESADHAEFYWFPDTGTALTKRNTRLPAGTPLEPLPPWRAWVSDELLANRVFEGVCRVAARAPGLVPRLNRVSAAALGARTYSDHSHAVFTSRRRVKFRETEWAVPREDAASVLRTLREEHARRGLRVAFPVEVRFAPADDVWLSTAYGRDTVYIAAHQYWRMAHEPWFAVVEDVARAAGGRPHWGKLHSLGAAELADLYPRFADAVRVRDQVDPGRLFANAHLRDVLGP